MLMLDEHRNSCETCFVKSDCWHVQVYFGMHGVQYSCAREAYHKLEQCVLICGGNLERHILEATRIPARTAM